MIHNDGTRDGMTWLERKWRINIALWVWMKRYDVT